MIPAAFSYLKAETAAEAVGLLAEHGEDAKLLAGGHSLLPLMKLRLAQPDVVIDIGRIPELSYVRDAGDHVAIGATTRHRDIERSALLAETVPLLAHAAATVGDVQIRHRGTIGGSLVHGDPASDLPSVILALDGTLVIQGPGGRREVAARDFFTGFWETAVRPDELLVEIRVPMTTGPWSFKKFNRRAQDWAIVGVAAQRFEDRTAVALVNMGATPVRASAVEQALAGGADAGEASRLAAAGTEPIDDLNGSAGYRRHLACVLAARSLGELE